MSDSYEEEVVKFEDEPSFSLHDFKKWMSSQKDKPARKKSELIGLEVESKIGLKRLLTKISTEEGNLREMAKDFFKFGGLILDVDPDNNLTVEVDAGTFVIPRYFVKKRH